MSDAALPLPASPEADILSALGTRSIVLVGMMGVGKSTIGRRMAARLKLPFVDADTEIETSAQMTIPEIFERHGEPYFRDGEARVIARLLDGGPVVLATGGGAFMREETRCRIRDKAVSIWLKADGDVILKRVRRRADRRCHRAESATLEHKLELVNTISDRVVVLDYGKKIAEGVQNDIQRDPLVIEAYLGRRRAVSA